MTFLQPGEAKPKVLHGCKNVVEQKLTKGESPTGFLRNPKRRTGAEHIPFVMCRCAFFYFCKAQ
jgi:hypothetical protein